MKQLWFMSSSVHLFSLRLFSYFFLSYPPSGLRLNVYGSFGRIWRVSNRCHFSTNDDDSENRFDKAFISRLMMLRRLAQMSSSSQLLIIRFLSFKLQILFNFSTPKNGSISFGEMAFKSITSAKKPKLRVAVVNSRFIKISN